VYRLDRLVVLLETGSTTLVRTTAAQQLADIQRQHPHELYNLLARVAPNLRNREWECRVAAGKAIGGIAEHVPLWNPNKDDMQEVKAESVLLPIHEEDDDLKLDAESDAGIAKALTNDEDGRLSFDTFDPVQVLRNGEKLLGSAGEVTFCRLKLMYIGVRRGERVRSKHGRGNSKAKAAGK
jgi:TATA-binding protein-associated factor